jgi:hypothetical protein
VSPCLCPCARASRRVMSASRALTACDIRWPHVHLSVPICHVSRVQLTRVNPTVAAAFHIQTVDRLQNFFFTFNHFFLLIDAPILTVVLHAISQTMYIFPDISSHAPLRTQYYMICFIFHNV